MSTREKQFWCSCGLGYKVDTRRDRHCLLMKHEPADDAPARVRRRARERSVEGRAGDYSSS
jgi:hypothetical protein